MSSQQFKKLSRRDLIKYSTASALLPFATGEVYASQKSEKKGAGRIVVIGGGFGGAAAAKYLKRYNPELNVTLIEPSDTYVTCPGSNWVLGGLQNMQYITHNYAPMKKHGVNVIHQFVENIDFDKKSISLVNGDKVPYDKVIVSPGIDFKWDVHEGVDANTAQHLPHAYKAGAQTTLLKSQIDSMPQGGTFAMVAPPNPFRCPPGPYERISMVAHRLKMINPRAKIVILDQKNKFSKQKLFQEGWDMRYRGMIEWVAKDSGGNVEAIDVKNKIVRTEFDEVKADVINYIPPQKAGKLAFTLGLTNDSGFCPVNQETFESTIQKDVYVIGDSSISGAMPKSGHSASSQAKLCAANIVRTMAGYEAISKKNVNTCYSLIAPDYGISVAAVYDFVDGKIVKVKEGGGVSPTGANPGIRAQEAIFTQGWYKSITNEVWG